MFYTWMPCQALVHLRLKAVVFTTDAQTLSVMNQVLDNFEIETEVCRDSLTAIEKVRTTKLDTVIMDWVETESADILSALRTSEQNAKSTVLAMVNGDLEMKAAGRAGANFTMYKPLNVEQAVRFLRASYGSMLHQRRQATRCPADVPVIAHVPGERPIEGRITDLSVKGLGFRCTHDIQVNQQLSVEFMLPGISVLLRINGRVMNVITLGICTTRVGICFSSVPQNEFTLLEQWVSDHLPTLPNILTSGE